MNTPFVSVVLPTYNRREMLMDATASLADQDYPHSQYEVIVVDDGSEDGTYEWLREEAVHWGGRLIPLRQDNAGPATARNRGIAGSRGEVIGFIDDDCIADPSWLSELVAEHEDEQVAGVGGQVLPDRVDHWMQRYYAHRSVLQRPPVTEGGIAYVVTANASFRRDVLLEVGGFDERMTLAAGEDIELSRRVRERGYSLRYRPRALVYHRYSRSLHSFARTFYRYGVGIVLYERLHPGDTTGCRWRWSLAWLRWPRDLLRYRLNGKPWDDAVRFAWLDALRDLMLLAGVIRGRTLYRHAMT